MIINKRNREGKIIKKITRKKDKHISPKQIDFLFTSILDLQTE